MRLGWRPADFWSATLHEVETAIWVSSAAAAEATAWTDDETREFFRSVNQSTAVH